MAGDDIVLHGRAAKARARDDAELAEALAAISSLDERADRAADAVVPPNTRRAYELELACFASWCSRHGLPAMPAHPKAVRAYLFELADKGRDPLDLATGAKPRGPFGYSAILRALSAICRSHRRAGHASVWGDPLITEARDTLARLKGTAPKRQKRDVGVTGEGLLFRVCDVISDDTRGVRDRAMILVGWQGGGRRRSEICAARVEHFQPVEGGDRVDNPPQQGRPDGQGAPGGPHPLGRRALLPRAGAEALAGALPHRAWVRLQGRRHGHRGRHGGAPRPQGGRPAGAAVRRPPRARPDAVRGRSLQSGFVTSAYKLGRKVPDIMEATGHHNPQEVLTYIRRAGLVEESAARGLVDEALSKQGPK